MARLGEGDLADAVDAAAAELGLDPAFVEKDYWVTQVLRSLADRFGASIVFKGGTSLSKGFGIIERFSEDVDILVRPFHGASVRQLEERLREMTERVSDDLGATWTNRHAGRGRRASRADVVTYPQHRTPAVELPHESAGVLLEAGYGDGREPSEVVRITPLLCEPLGISPDEYEDTAPFEIAALAPARTLLEKVVLLHHVATRVESGDDTAGHARIGRHYHDVDKLLAHQPTVRWLRDVGADGATHKLIAEIETISAQQYGGYSPRPHGGYCAGPAFSPPYESELRRWLDDRYHAAQGLLPHLQPGRWPTFETTLTRIRAHAELL